jgi:hypothetical protein
MRLVPPSLEDVFIARLSSGDEAVATPPPS